MIDSRSDEVSGTIPVGDEPEGIAVGKGFAWVANKADDTVTRIDLDGAPRAAEGVGDGPIQIALDREGPWVTLTGEDAVVRLDPKSGKPTGDRIDVEGAPRGIAFAAGMLWVSATKANRIVVADPGSKRVVDRIKVAREPARGPRG